ncbi:MAG: hypothetical protein H6741_11870 [Alphaproteobacteria bacterium]|nr:hypothetical protein [Alphaproteobacteria bacterium]MCB9793409.1 hypothetical protein [Alphaproteobacteria bacterium]
MRKQDLPVPEPCQADWAEMSGDARRRFCASCQKHVHHLSEMTRDEAVRLIATEKELCVRYEVQPDGEVRFQPETLGLPPRPVSRRRSFGAMMAGLALTLPTGCGTAEAGAAATDAEPKLLEQAAEAVSEWLFGPEEGCELTEPRSFEDPPSIMGNVAAPSPDEALEPAAEPEPEPVQAPPPPPRRKASNGLLRSGATMGVLMRDGPGERTREQVLRELDELSKPPKR